MKFSGLLGLSEFFALDIGSSAVRIAQLRGSGTAKSLVRYGSQPIDAKMAESVAINDRRRLIDAIATGVTQTGVTTKDVVVGIPSNKMFATVVDFPKLSADELNKTIQYQLESHIPMKVEETKADWAVVGDSPRGSDQYEVLISAVPNSYVESRMDMLESIGLNVVAFEPDVLGLVRSLLPAGSTGASLILDIGDMATDLVVVYEGTPRLIRSIPTGGRSFIKSAEQNLNIDEKQAAQFVFKFGLNQDKLEGQVYRAIEGTVDGLVAEVQKSIKFFSNRYKGIAIEKIIVSGGASALPGFPLHLANNLGVQVEIGNAWMNVSYPQSMHNDLIALSNHFAVVVGLAERTE